MKLAVYLAQPGVSQTQIARRVGVSQAAISRYATGRRVPRPDVMARIRDATGGQVQPNDWFEAAEHQDTPTPEAA
ncbi:MAG: helix-turn-helix transcriptional regulator [Phenylobacterium sp.]|uniref:helix-turn-helix domain-containing protein n=1 Tax=Phenylobacterium sp. TaxID=1871053 RepID=UPI0025EB8208|nr:helix-turn-helix transcriptional regulator [Phenylobacterium sp.]MCA6305262.1 helix-turn-helix transcriptional regulator [Phenylobacterium sp.]